MRKELTLLFEFGSWVWVLFFSVSLFVFGAVGGFYLVYTGEVFICM